MRDNQPARGEYRGWDWVVRSYQGTKFCVETVHRGQQSLDTELAAIAKLGRQAYVWSVDREGRVAVTTKVLRAVHKPKEKP